ncbi:MAG: class I SAM-dependent methyltransferase [Ramlibacter sp.]|nr:class I SAM-dependent methyltransferase [Ramlibacter sp.]
MNTTPPPAPGQSALWNGPGGHAWVDAQPLLDQVLQPFEDLLVEGVRSASPSRVLDVGCGTGSTTVAIARLLGNGGQCTGVDISQPMIDAARARAAREGVAASFVIADAQTHPFEPGGFDMIVSRFGVMFFQDPVAAFANLRRAASANASMRLIVFRGGDENPFMTAAERAARPLMSNLPPRKPDGPGQFAFADRQRVAGILQQSGWTGIDIQPVDVECVLPEKDLVGYFTRLGPVGTALRDADEATRSRVIDTVRPAFDPFVRGAEVRFTSACWMIVDSRRPRSS